MTLELYSEATGRTYKISDGALGRVLHLVRQLGWNPERAPRQWSSDSWQTEISLPHFAGYMPRRFSRGDAEDLRVTLTRAMATGAVAAERTIDFAAATLLEVARKGAFRVHLKDSEAEEFAVGGYQQALASW